MEEEIKLLKEKYFKIKEMGYVEGIGFIKNGAGLTFEKLLGKETDNFSFPDYYGIEIKTKLVYSKMPIHLFTLIPDGKEFFEIKRIVNTYGYICKGEKFRKFYLSVKAGELSKSSIFHLFSLNVNYEKKRVEFLVYDRKGNLTNNDTYWDFDSLKKVVERKLKYLALIKTFVKTENDKRYYKYSLLNIYKLKSFEDFLVAIEKGKIIITFAIDYFKDKKRYGQVHDHGTAFTILENDLKSVFTKIY